MAAFPTALTQWASATTGSTADLDANFNKVGVSAMNYCSLAAGTANDLVVNGLVPIADYYIGMTVEFLASSNNSGAATLAYNNGSTTLAAFPLVDIAGTALTANAIVSGNYYTATMVQTLLGVVQWRLSGNGGGAVSSVFGRTGAIIAQAGDYSIGQISGAGSMASQNSDAVMITGGSITAASISGGTASGVRSQQMAAAWAYFSGSVTLNQCGINSSVVVISPVKYTLNFSGSIPGAQYAVMVTTEGVAPPTLTIARSTTKVDVSMSGSLPTACSIMVFN